MECTVATFESDLALYAPHIKHCAAQGNVRAQHIIDLYETWRMQPSDYESRSACEAALRDWTRNEEMHRRPV